jgi:hypothetical protein
MLYVSHGTGSVLIPLPLSILPLRSFHIVPHLFRVFGFLSLRCVVSLYGATILTHDSHVFFALVRMLREPRCDCFTSFPTHSLHWVLAITLRGLPISLRFCLNVNLLILSATSKYRVKIMNSRIVDMRRYFPLSETFPKLQKKSNLD